MTTLRQAAQQALEALEYHVEQTRPIHRTSEAITNLRAALAQEPTKTTLSRGVNGVCSRSACECEREGLGDQCIWLRPTDAELERRTGLRFTKAGLALNHNDPTNMQNQVNPMQEPVAWLYTGIKQDGTEHGPHLVWKPEYMDAMSASKGAKATPLYTAPPQRKPLTKEQFLYIYNQLPNWGMDMDSLPQGLEKFARAVERAHGIGGQP